MKNFAVRGYIISVDGNRMTLRVDAADIELIGYIATINKRVTTAGNFITINIRTATFEIKNLDWSELSDLKGVHIRADCQVNISEFRKKITIPAGYKSSGSAWDVSTSRIVSFMAKTIKNVD